MTDWPIILCAAFVIGCFAFMCFVAARELIAVRRQLREPLHEFECDCCPWPDDLKFPHRMAGVPKEDR